MKSKSIIKLLGLILVVALASSAGATVLDTFTGSVAATDPTQMGRLFRSGVPSDWSAAKAFPGITSPTTTFNYVTFVVPAADLALTPYVQIDVDSVATTTFASAYLGSYSPGGPAPNLGLDTNYLGDPGSSGNYYGVDPQFFQVFVPAGNDLVLVMSTTSTLGLDQPFTLTVEGFIDTMYTDPAPAPVPEPASILLVGSGLALLVRRMRKSA